jgi:hypothetical protein
MLAWGEFRGHGVPGRVAPRDYSPRAPLADGLTPSYKDVCGFTSGPFAEPHHCRGWKFEHFVVDPLLGCSQGYEADDKKDTTLANLFGGRTAPISSAVAITIDAPANAALVELQS